MVVRAGRRSSPDSEKALAELCQMYWYPLYAYVRRRVRSREDAEDLIQSFFARFLAGNDLEGLDAERGRFRAFLLASLKHFLANEADRAGRQKRGGGIEHLSWDWTFADHRYLADAEDVASPDRLFDREWALALLERVIERVRAANVAAGKGALFEATKSFLTYGVEAIPYAKAAEELGMEEGAVRVAVHRLRKQYREMLRDEIEETLADPIGVDEELRSLRAAVAG